jgi:hypothetical protein
MKTVEVPNYKYVGMHVKAVCEDMAKAASIHGNEYITDFNGITLRARPGEYVSAMMERYNLEVAKQQYEYLLTQDAVDAEYKRMQDLNDKLYTLQVLIHGMGNFKELLRNGTATDFLRWDDHAAAILRWWKELQPVADDRNIYVPRSAILRAFHNAGFAPNANCGPDYDPNDRDKSFRYLVGQCMDGLAQVGAPHPVCIKVIDDWLEKWGR